MGQWERERTREMVQPPSSTPMLVRCWLCCQQGSESDRVATDPVWEADVFTAGKPRCNGATVAKGLHLWEASQRRRHLRGPERMSSHW